MVMELGEIRQEMEKGEADVLEGIIAKHANKTSYYILKHSNWEGPTSNVLRTRYSLRTYKPKIPLIGTKLWLINNSKGTITLEWDLPMDIKDANMFSSDNIIPHNFHSAKDHGFALWNA